VPSPDVVLTLSAVYAGVSMIAEDIASMPCTLWRYLDDAEEGKERARDHELYDVLRWQPNAEQTAKEYWSLKVGQMLLRGGAYSRIVSGRRGFADQMLPLHNDRLRIERLRNGRLNYHISGYGEDPYDLTDDEVFKFRDFSTGGLKSLSRFAYGLRSLQTAITQEVFTLNFFRKGATGGLIASIKDADLDPDSPELKTLHGAIARFIAGAENAGGILAIPGDVVVSAISQDLEKAQLKDLKQQAIHDVERWLKMPAGRLGGQDQTHADAAVSQGNLQYYTTCLRPIIVGIEQSIRRDLIIDKQQYFAEFNMDALLRADLKTRAEAYRMLIEARVMWPSEARVKENMNRDERLDQLFEQDRRPGVASGAPPPAAALSVGSGQTARASVRSTLLVYEAAQRVLRKEIAAVTKLAEKTATDPKVWREGLATFYGEHAGFVAQALRLSEADATGYASAHREALETHGVGIVARWERLEAERLAALALDVEGAPA
jgi:HK97 family phage portal protein